MIGSKPLHITSNKIDGFIRVYDGITYLVLFGFEKYDAIYDKIRCLNSQKTGITYIFLITMCWFIWLFVSRKNAEFA